METFQVTTDGTFTREDRKYMKAALKQAEKAIALGEVPIGAVIVENGRIIGRGYNRRNTDHTTLAHAEITAIRKANRKVGDWRLEGCTLYVTLEPCQMCAGALVQSRIDKVPVPDRQGRDRRFKLQVGMRRHSSQYSAERGVQSPGGSRFRPYAGGVHRDPAAVL